MFLSCIIFSVAHKKVSYEVLIRYVREKMSWKMMPWKFLKMIPGCEAWTNFEGWALMNKFIPRLPWIKNLSGKF